MNTLKRTMGTLVACAMLTSCASMEMSEEDKARLGGALGAIAGALIANEAGASDWQVILAGVAAGYAGYRIGKHLGRNDEAALRARAASALATAEDGETVEWSSTESGARATITTTNTREETKEIDILRDQRVASPRRSTSSASLTPRWAAA